MKAAVLLAGLAFLLASDGRAATRTTVSLAGEVFDADGRPLSAVVITTDEVGIRSGTDGKGRFLLGLPARVAASGVRVHFEATGYLPFDLVVPRLPHKPLHIVLVSLYTPAVSPMLPAGYSAKLAKYRATELQGVRDFLADRNRRLLIVDGLPGVGAADLVVTALRSNQAARPPVFWWSCTTDEDALLLAGELGKALRNPHLAEFTLEARRTLDKGARRRLDQAASREILSGLERSPRLLVFEHFELWLGRDTSISKPDLAQWLTSLVTRGAQAKVILIADEVPTLPADLPAAWKAKLTVGGLRPAAASDYLKSVLGVELRAGSRLEIAVRYEGNPFALELFAARLSGLDAKGRESEVRELLATHEERLPGAALRKLFDSTHSRLAADEAWSLDLLALARQPLSVAELLEIDRLAGSEPRPGRVSAGALDGLRTRLHLAGETFSGSPAVAHYYAPELVRDYVGDLLAVNEARRRRLHGALFLWYRERFVPPKSFSTSTLSPAEVQGYDELAYHAFAFAEVAHGSPRKEAAVAGAQAALATRNAHTLAHAQRLMIAEFERALRLLAGETAKSTRQFYADCAFNLADILKDSPAHDEADKWYREAEVIFQEFGDKQGEANLEFSRAMQLVTAEQFAAAEPGLKSALASYLLIRDDQGTAAVLSTLGAVEVRLDRPQDATRDLEKSIPIFEKIRDRQGMATAIMRLGEIEQTAENFPAARGHFAQAEKIAGEEPDASWLRANTLNAQAEIDGKWGHFSEADDEYRKALAIFRDVEDELGEVNALFGLAYDRAARGEYPDALQEMRSVKARFKNLQEPTGLIRSGFTLASELNDRGQRSEAASEFLDALLVAGRAGNQIKEVIKIGADLRHDTDTKLFDREVDRQLQTMATDDQRVIQPLLDRIRKVQPGTL